MTDRPSPLSDFDADRRESPRERMHLAARVVLPRGGVVDAVIVDRSLKGMRVQLATEAEVPRNLTLLELNAAMVHEADVVWTRERQLGLAIRSSASVRTASGKTGEALRRLWRDAMVR